jgi:hypothetical protein
MSLYNIIDFISNIVHRIFFHIEDDNVENSLSFTINSKINDILHFLVLLCRSINCQLNFPLLYVIYKLSFISQERMSQFQKIFNILAFYILK